MKKITVLLLIFVLLAGLCGCEKAKSPETLFLESLLFISQEEVEYKLVGQPRQTVLDMWGQPSGVYQDPKADFFQIPYSDQIIIVYYDAENYVSSVKLAERKK